jgi:prepilin-type N-terminal cleavage/methylation domain-containing protein
MPQVRITDIRHQTSDRISAKSETKGFTLIELMVAITILAVLATIGLTTYTKAQQTARDGKRKDDLRSVATALELYYQSQNPHVYPATGWSAMSTALDTDFINQIPTDPINSSPYQYAYTSSSSTTYDLCARLENDTSPNGNGVEGCDNNCSSLGSSANKCVHIPNP